MELIVTTGHVKRAAGVARSAVSPPHDAVGTSASLPVHPRVPRGKARVGANDLLVIHRACSLIDELGADLDARLKAEPRATERLRLLRTTTNRITRTANDAIQAYRRARRAVDAELERSHGSAEGALAVRTGLQSARLDLLRALRVAGLRYPETSASAAPTTDDPATAKR